MSKAKVITFAFQKGGIAKTTSTCNLAAGLNKVGYSVLVVDADTQSSLSRVSGANITDNVMTLADVLSKKCDASDAVQHLEQYDIIPSKASLISFQDNMSSIPNKEFLLSRSIVKPLKESYDYIIFDTNASFSDLAKSAIVAADELIIPMIADEQSYSSLPQQISTINALNEGYEEWIPPTKIAGILITMFHPSYNIDRKYDQRIKEYAESKGINVFDTHIRFSTAIKESQSERKNIFESNGNSAVAQDYFEFLEEYLNQGSSK